MERFWKRLLTVPLTMLVVSFLVFACISFSEGDSSAYILPEDATEEARAGYREAVGLDAPFPLRYASFMADFLTGRWGMTAAGHDVSEMILSRLPVTISLAAMSLVISLAIAVPVSYLTLRRRSIGDMASTASAAVISSLPVFLVALLLSSLLAVRMHLFPTSGFVPPSKGIGYSLGSLFLPSLSLSLLHSSLMMLLFRKALRDSMEKPFTTAAIAYGMSRRRALFRCATRPSLPILAAVAGESAAAFIGGSAAVESVFALPGIGSLMVSAALGRDTALAGTLVMLIALMISLISLLSEAAIRLLDPRRRS